MKRVLQWGAIIVVALVVILVVASVAGGGGSKSKEGEQAQNATTSAASATVAATGTPGQGDAVRVGSVSLEVTGVVVGWTSPNPFDSPGAGKQYVRVGVRLVNQGSGRYDYNPLYFQLADSTEARHDIEIVAGGNDELTAGMMGTKSEAVRGELYFAIPAGARPTLLLYEPLLSTNHGRVDLSPFLKR